MRSDALGAALCAALIAGCGSAAKNLTDVQKCLSAGGYRSSKTPVPGQQLAVEVPSKPADTTFTVTIQPSDKEARQMVSDETAMFGPKGANTGGGAEAKDRVVVSWARPVAKRDLERVKSCAF